MGSHSFLVPLEELLTVLTALIILVELIRATCQGVSHKDEHTRIHEEMIRSTERLNALR